MELAKVYIAQSREADMSSIKETLVLATNESWYLRIRGLLYIHLGSHEKDVHVAIHVTVEEKSTWDLRSCGRAHSFRFRLAVVWLISWHLWVNTKLVTAMIRFPFTLGERCFDGQARWVPQLCMICTPRAQRDDIVVGKTCSLVNLSTAFIRGTT